MKKFSLALVAIMGYLFVGFGQYGAVNFDLDKNYFNEGQPLTAEKPLMFNGLVPKGIDIIEISIFPAKAKNEKNLLYLASWKDFDNDTNTSFSIAVNYPLRASEKYDFRLDYYQRIDAAKQEELHYRIVSLAIQYLEANINIKGKTISLANSKKKIMADLDQIVETVLDDYRAQDGIGFDGFSQTIHYKLEQIENATFGKMPKDSTAVRAKSEREMTVADKIADLEKAITSQIRKVTHKSWSKLTMSRYIDDYETEPRKGSFSINVGYGGVYLEGSLNELSYDAAPYMGLSFPLSNSTLAPKFMRNSSVTMGVFLQNMEDKHGNRISGVLVGRPLYLGLDYKIFEFVRFNAGAAFLEKTVNSPNGGDSLNQSILIRPFIGLSARIDLSIGFGK